MHAFVNFIGYSANSRYKSTDIVMALYYR